MIVFCMIGWIFNALFEFTNKLVKFKAHIDYLNALIDQLLIKIDLFGFSHALMNLEKVSFLTDVIIYINKLNIYVSFDWSLQ